MTDNLSDLSLEERATNYETYKHIDLVTKLLLAMQIEISKRIATHDRSKLESPEVSIFTEFTPKLASVSYGTQEYFERLKQMKPALDSHYAHNRHHPEFFENGVNDMNLIDLLEMMVDWYASCCRHSDGDINRSIEINRSRFGLSDQLTQILKKSVELIECSMDFGQFKTQKDISYRDN